VKLRHKFVILLTALLLSSLTVQKWKQHRTGTRGPAQSNSNGFNYESLKKLIQDNQSTSVDDVLPKLPEDCRSHFVLVRNSRSLQYGDDLNPRVILRCDSSRLLLSFSNDSRQPGYNTLEAIQFDDPTATFGFKEITFNGSGKTPSLNESPTSCIQCHRTSPRPNWDTYDFWPGVYGGEGTGGQIIVGSPEDTAFRAFLKTHDGKQDRYSSLIGLMKYSDVAGSITANSTSEHVPLYFAVPDVSDINSSISKLNFMKIMKEMQSLPDYQKYKFAALAAVAGCTQIESFIPASVKVENSRVSYNAIDTDTRNAYRSYVIEKFKRQRNFSRGPTEHPVPPLSPAAPYYDPEKDGINGYGLQLADPIASLRYIMALQKKDIEHWFIARDEGSYDFSDGGYAEQQLSALLAEEVIASNPEFKSSFNIKFDPDILIKYLTNQISPETCENLKKISLQALSTSGETAEANPIVAKANFNSAPNIVMPKSLNTCVQCHAMKIEGIPSIPFNNPQDLKPLLNQGNYPRGALLEEIYYRVNTNGPDHMPQGKYLDSVSKTELEEYFKTLSAH
jgi:hypothetical protein